MILNSRASVTLRYRVNNLKTCETHSRTTP
jgi:hypothetical protein